MGFYERSKLFEFALDMFEVIVHTVDLAFGIFNYCRIGNLTS